MANLARLTRIVLAVMAYVVMLGFVVVPCPVAAQNTDLNAWVGQSPMTVINGETFLEAAGFDPAAVLYDSERAPSNRWSGVAHASAHFPVLGTDFHVYGYLFSECRSPCASPSLPTGWFFVYFNGPDYNLEYAGINSDTGLAVYCSYGSDAWACENTQETTLPAGSSDDIAQAIDETYHRLSAQGTPPFHYDPYQACLDDGHIDAYCQKYFGH